MFASGDVEREAARLRSLHADFDRRYLEITRELVRATPPDVHAPLLAALVEANAAFGRMNTEAEAIFAAFRRGDRAEASKDVFLAGAAWSGRAFVMGRQVVDTAKAQVFVHVHGGAREVSIGAANGQAQARTDGGWAPGAMGRDVFFQDVEIGSGETTISAMGAVVPEKIPLAAGKMTNVTIVAR